MRKIIFFMHTTSSLDSATLPKNNKKTKYIFEFIKFQKKCIQLARMNPNRRPSYRLKIPKV